MISSLKCNNQRHDRNHHTHNGTSYCQPCVAGTTLYALALIGLNINDIILLQIIGRRIEYALLIKQIEKQYGVDRERDNCEKLRKRLIGMSYGCGKDAKFVIDWAENHGVKDKHGNLNKRLFNYYNTAELLTLIGVFTKVCKHYKEKENAKD